MDYAGTFTDTYRNLLCKFTSDNWAIWSGVHSSQSCCPTRTWRRYCRNWWPKKVRPWEKTASRHRAFFLPTREIRDNCSVTTYVQDLNLSEEYHVDDMKHQVSGGRKKSCKVLKLRKKVWMNKRLKSTSVRVILTSLFSYRLTNKMGGFQLETFFQSTSRRVSIQEFFSLLQREERPERFEVEWTLPGLDRCRLYRDAI